MSGSNTQGLKVADTSSYVKQFSSGQNNYINWGIKSISKLNNHKFITPFISNTTSFPTYIPNGLIVGGSIHSSDGLIYTLSDERLKKNIKNIEDDELFTLNPIMFSYKNDTNNKTHFGLLAQNVEKTYPELVETTNTGYKSVNYQELIPLMLSKMKKMQHEIDELKERKISL